jgi:hypothetical protein
VRPQHRPAQPCTQKPCQGAAVLALPQTEGGITKDPAGAAMNACRLRGSRRLLCCRTAATAGCGRSRLRTWTGLCVDRRLLRLARPLRLGPRLLGAASASPHEVGAWPGLL